MNKIKFTNTIKELVKQENYLSRFPEYKTVKYFIAYGDNRYTFCCANPVVINRVSFLQKIDKQKIIATSGNDLNKLVKFLDTCKVETVSFKPVRNGIKFMCGNNSHVLTKTNYELSTRIKKEYLYDFIHNLKYDQFIKINRSELMNAINKSGYGRSCLLFDLKFGNIKIYDEGGFVERVPILKIYKPIKNKDKTLYLIDNSFIFRVLSGFTENEINLYYNMYSKSSFTISFRKGNRFIDICICTKDDKYSMKNSLKRMYEKYMYFDLNLYKGTVYEI